ncbi:class I SAM-dependent methyltransferase [Rhodocyclus gracilis]|uniref:class I SAM-dependent methyltransferase n=1 Tax=Rhodocyclus gracilis TaxID=2929842 RepID=UPI0030F3F25A
MPNAEPPNTPHDATPAGEYNERHELAEAPPAPAPDTPSEPPALAARPLRQLALQGAATLLVVSLAWPWFGMRGETLPWPETAFAIGGAALLLATLTRQPWWWKLIHLAFVPLAWLGSQVPLAPGWFFCIFLLLLLIYRGTLTGQAPLFLSNEATALALAEITADRPNMRFVDLGAGLGSVILPLARVRPDARLTGVENAPLVWAIGRLRTWGKPRCRWQWGDLRQADLRQSDVVYAFLSPLPMPDLWKKVCAEMPAGSLFISNSFAVPDVPATTVVEVGDRRQTRLYCYQR